MLSLRIFAVIGLSVITISAIPVPGDGYQPTSPYQPQYKYSAKSEFSAYRAPSPSNNHNQKHPDTKCATFAYQFDQLEQQIQQMGRGMGANLGRSRTVAALPVFGTRAYNVAVQLGEAGCPNPTVSKPVAVPPKHQCDTLSGRRTRPLKNLGSTAEPGAMQAISEELYGVGWQFGAAHCSSSVASNTGGMGRSSHH
ncbi:hypothetical protein FRB93_004149 [Tulasnella sp. JGI-2019a]|nr:hypothetical protein FRB93_004149 [Tulasnella sp. JGI-2019a]